MYQKFLQKLRSFSGQDFDINNEGSLIHLPLRQYTALNQLAIELAKEWSFWAPSVLGEAEEGNKSPVTGNALNLLYSNSNFKGVAPGKPGNPKVGGDLGTPSFVVIESNFPNSGEPYQTVTIFGAEQSDRAAFAEALPAGAIQVE